MERNTNLFYAVILFAAFFCACSLGSCRRVGDPITESLDSLMSTVFANGEPGATLIVSRGDSIVYERSFGLCNLATGKPMRPSTMMCLASSTKRFTAVAILKLQLEGKLSLDDAITKYFPMLPEDVFGSVTLRHMLTQTSGIPDRRPTTPEEWRSYTANIKSVFGNNSDFLIYGREDELTAYLRQVDSLSFTPGTAFEKQNPPYMLLTSVIEQASGKNFETFMYDDIFEPAGLLSATFITPDSEILENVHSYRLAEGAPKPGVFRSADGRWEEYDLGEAKYFLSRADRGLYMSAIDFSRWQSIFLSDVLLTPDAVQELERPLVPTSFPGVSYNMGLYVVQKPGKPLKLYKRSAHGGFVAIESLFPETGTSYVILSNRNDWDRKEMSDKLEDILHHHRLI